MRKEASIVNTSMTRSQAIETQRTYWERQGYVIKSITADEVGVTKLTSTLGSNNADLEALSKIDAGRKRTWRIVADAELNGA